MTQQRRQIELKSRTELATMRRAAAILARVMAEVREAVAPGITTLELDKLARTRIKEAKVKPAFLGLYGFPNTLCISVNEEVVHGIPGKRVLEEGDIVSVDCGVLLEGFFSDMAFTQPVGGVTPDVQRLLDVTRESLERAIAACRPGNRLGDIGHAVQSHVEGSGMAVVLDYGGHGIGRALHEEPRVENFGPAGQGERLRPGMVLAIEPMVSLGSPQTRVLDDNWTVVTEDGAPAAHFEHTVAITEEGAEILTLPQAGERALRP